MLPLNFAVSWITPDTAARILWLGTKSNLSVEASLWW